MLSPISYWPVAVGIFLLFSAFLYPMLSVQSFRDFSVAYEDLEEVSAIHQIGKTLFISQEKRQNDGKIISITNGVRSTIINGLQKPDGLTFSNNNLIFTQESGVRPVLELIKGIPNVLFESNGAEGISSTKNGDIYVIEDRPAGRLLKYTRESRQVTELVTDLEKAEAVCAMENGDVYYSENGMGIVYQLISGESVVYLRDLVKPGYLYCDENLQGIWITEDRTNFGRLLFSDEPHFSHTVAAGLHSPQSITFDQQGNLLLAEQGRDRILQFERPPEGESW
jgi:hypothetical protein